MSSIVDPVKVDDNNESTDNTETNQVADEYEPKQPSIRLYEIQHLLTLSESLVSTTRRDELEQEAMKLIKDNLLISYYKAMFPRQIDLELIDEMKRKTQKRYEEFEQRLEEAEETGTEKDLLDIRIDRAKFACSTGDTIKMSEYYDPILIEYNKNTHAIIQLRFEGAKYALSTSQYALYTEYVNILSTLVDKHGEWDDRNRLSIYQGIDALLHHDLHTANIKFINAVPTFSTTELLSMEHAMIIATILAVIHSSSNKATSGGLTLATKTMSLHDPRNNGRYELKEKIGQSPEVIQALLGYPEVKSFLDSFLKCSYGEYYTQHLASLRSIIQCMPPYFATLIDHIIKECRIVAYTVYFSSFRTVSLATFYNVFQIPENEQESTLQQISSLIHTGRLRCHIDLIDNTLHPTDSYVNNTTYQNKMLLDRADKLSSRTNKLVQQLKQY